MSRRVSRLHALLASAILLFANGRGMLGPLDCPQHGIQKTATGAPGHRGTATTHDARLTTHDTPRTTHHAPAVTHHAPAEKQNHQQHSGCTCLEHCSACQVSGMPSVAVRVPEIRVIIGRNIVAPTAADRAPERAPHQLPFAQAPPAVV